MLTLLHNMDGNEIRVLSLPLMKMHEMEIGSKKHVSKLRQNKCHFYSQ